MPAPARRTADLICTADAECGVDRKCATTAAHDGHRYCDHADADGDHVGDVCDSCRFLSNPLQTLEGGAQEDDLDNDGIGNDCETTTACEKRADPPPHGLYAVSVGGLCCTTQYPGDGQYVPGPDGSWDCEGLCDPDGFPILRVCNDEADPDVDLPDGKKCRPLPDALVSRQGMLELPPGCEQALAQAGKCDPMDPGCSAAQANRRLTLQDIEDATTLWGNLCSLPQWDQDFDGIGDACDLCPYQFDPSNAFYVDPSSHKAYPDRGRYCNGEYAPDQVCADQEQEPEGETGTGGSSESG